MRELEYQPEIDGLRAIAVMSVFLFHLDRRLMPGGFVGVDVFYVISGYLITSLLYRDCLNHDFSFARFYQRRIARLFPALFTAALATLGLASVVYLSQDLASAGANLAAASLSVANFKYMLQGNYFAISPDAQPYLHYWSLSVEEQFYLVFPALLLLAYRHLRAQLLPLLLALAITSLALSLWLTKVNHVWAFYLLPTRAWELGVGGFLAVTMTPGGGHERPVPGWLLPLGLGVVLASFVVITEGASFPGWWALPPVLGTAAVIAASPANHGLLKAGLSSAPATAIGRMSYSLYLWHWPVFSLIDYRFYQ
ncbi:MAG TPA: acyltransferase, partial [Steroidobacteraceae bacterium]|nr:acyltransferase [Steroidobacteraceae bacterium]